MNNQDILCDMVLIEDGETFEYTWECSNCLTQFEDTVEHENNKICPYCKSKIINWVDID